MTFLDLPNCDADSADVVLLPLPFQGTVCYGVGTALAPAAILRASAHVELWDEELDFDLDRLKYHVREPVTPQKPEDETPADYLRQVFNTACGVSKSALVIGIGGEHSLTPPLVRAAAERFRNDADDLTGVTVVQFDAHSDLRDEYEGTPHSHACAMRRVVERGATVIAIGIRSADREEFEYGKQSGRVETFFAQQLAESADIEQRLLDRLRTLAGDVYLTIDIDGLETTYCPATGTPQPGGLGWWQTLRYLRALLRENEAGRLIGADLVETALQPGTRVNEFTAAKLLCKLVGYRFAG